MCTATLQDSDNKRLWKGGGSRATGVLVSRLCWAHHTPQADGAVDVARVLVGVVRTPPPAPRLVHTSHARLAAFARTFQTSMFLQSQVEPMRAMAQSMHDFAAKVTGQPSAAEERSDACAPGDIELGADATA